MALLRRHSRIFALLFVLAAAVAAPYCLPENPEASVFRSGVFGALLLAGGLFPVQSALRRADARTLACAMAVALPFALALSLGSELTVYGGLLPGLGSAIRRAAVPVLAAPMIGGLLTRAMLARLPAPDQARRIPMAAFALALLLCWSPVLLSCFPGMLNYDFVGEYAQFRSGQYSAIHPLLYSALQSALLLLGERLHSATFGLFLTTATRMLCLAFALAYGCAFAQRRGTPRWALLLMTAFFALHPVFSFLAVSTSKDVPFAAALLALTLLSWELLEDPDGFLRRKSRYALFILMAVCTAHLRKNGLIALILLLSALIAAARGARARVLGLSICAAIACAALQAVLVLGLLPAQQPAGQLYSLPAQQLVRAYNVGEMADADRAELEGWYLYPTGLTVHAHNADRAKNNLDQERLAGDGGGFLALWSRVARSNRRPYAEAFLLLNMGLWYPGDVSHSEAYAGIDYDPYGYLEGNRCADELPELQTVCLLPAVREWVEEIARQNVHQKLPLLSLLFCTSTPFWVIAFASALFIARKRARALPAILGALGIWLSYFLGPCTLARYVLPLFCLAPVLLCVALSALPPTKEVSP